MAGGRVVPLGRIEYGAERRGQGQRAVSPPPSESRCLIRTLITDDSDTSALLLKAVLSADGNFEVVGHARDGQEAVRLNEQLQPQLITMDIRMPRMDGFEATRAIMSSRPIPIVVVASSVDDEELKITFRAIEEGALAVLEKLPAPNSAPFEQARRELTATLRAMAEVKVVRRWNRPRTEPAVSAAPRGRSFELLAIGCSTGGPQALQAILGALPHHYPLPIMVVQHIAHGFIGGLVEWLGGGSQLPMVVARDGLPLLPGHVYFAPDDHQLGVVRSPQQGLLAQVVAGAPVDRHLPSVTALFDSVANRCGSRGVGVLLTGMGEDGARGLLRLRQAGGHTLAQDEASSVVWGMPGTAVTMDAVDKVLPLAQIADYLATLVRR